MKTGIELIAERRQGGIRIPNHACVIAMQQVHRACGENVDRLVWFGACIAAEIDRLQRLSAPTDAPGAQSAETITAEQPAASGDCPACKAARETARSEYEAGGSPPSPTVTCTHGSGAQSAETATERESRKRFLEACLCFKCGHHGLDCKCDEPDESEAKPDAVRVFVHKWNSCIFWVQRAENDGDFWDGGEYWGPSIIVTSMQLVGDIVYELPPAEVPAFLTAHGYDGRGNRRTGEVGK